MKLFRVFLPGLALAGVVGLVAWAARTPVVDQRTASSDRTIDTSASNDVDAWFAARWSRSELEPAGPADELQILRRLSLALQGTIPSLEEIRVFENDESPDRLTQWTERMLRDVRFSDYFAERLARTYVGTEGGPFVIYRRGRFVDWLSDQLRENRPYDAMVRDVIASKGLWTDTPATNFVTIAKMEEGDIDANQLTSRLVRAFLGQRIDCAQCHDHPFDDWKQTEYEGLAAFFGQSQVTVAGLEDKSSREFRIVDDPEDVEDDGRLVEPVVPFHAEWLPDAGTRRERLAAWITHPENRRFERATVNRVWGLMFGRPWFPHVEVDDLPDPPAAGEEDLLDLLGREFRESGYDLRHLIHQIAASRVFRLDSAHEETEPGPVVQLEREWAVFPVTRLRPEQAIGAMLQAASPRTIDQNSHLLTRTIRLIRENNFIEEYGDLGADELKEHASTIPQALLRMNGELARELTEGNPFNASGRINGMSSTNEICIENCFLVCLTRRPNEAELAHFVEQFDEVENDLRGPLVEDLVWSLFNSPEFSWNH